MPRPTITSPTTYPSQKPRDRQQGLDPCNTVPVSSRVVLFVLTLRIILGMIAMSEARCCAATRFNDDVTRERVFCLRLTMVASRL